MDFLLELRSEEIPARMQEKACADLARLFAAEIAKAGLAATAIETLVTPRRLALIARGLPLATEPVSEETKGPRADAPAQALAGFLGKTGLTREQLVERPDAKGNIILFAVVERPGRATADVLAQAIPAIVRAFPWPKSMRWGAPSASTASLRWVRPLQGIVALLGDDVVPFAIDGIEAGAATLGHRFHHPGQITIGNADDYAAKLRACHVIVDPAERQAIIRDGANAAAAAQGLSIVPDEGLVAENAGLTEWPVPLLGRFDPAFLAVPREVIQLTMRTNQKYFACVDAEGALAPAFVCTANIDAADGGAGIVAGNAKVLAARLSDAKFFWEQDLRVPLAVQADKLGQIVFHEKLGTVADKVERVAKLARWLVEEGIVRPTNVIPAKAGISAGLEPTSSQEHAETPAFAGATTSELADMAETAAKLCKADLVTGMVGEFPELQGVMGGYYARAEGCPDAVADAIRDHYKPVGQGDEVPTAPVTVAVSLADKLDTLVGFFTSDERPSGSRDPFALRRSGLGILGLLFRNKLRAPVYKMVAESFNAHVLSSVMRIWELQSGDGLQSYEDRNFHVVQQGEYDLLYHADQLIFKALRKHAAELDIASRWPDPEADLWSVTEFFADRLKVQQREAGVRHDLIDAVFALGGEDDLVRLLARVHALQAFVATEDGANLLAGYKRAANILRIEEKRAPQAVIPAQAGIHTPGVGADADAVLMDSRLRGNDEVGARRNEEDGEGAEQALIAALDAAEPVVDAAISDEDFSAAMTALAMLRAPIDQFFEDVTVNDPDPVVRARRLTLLARIRVAVHKVADFSKIEG